MASKTQNNAATASAPMSNRFDHLVSQPRLNSASSICGPFVFSSAHHPQYGLFTRRDPRPLVRVCWHAEAVSRRACGTPHKGWRFFLSQAVNCLPIIPMSLRDIFCRDAPPDQRGNGTVRLLSECRLETSFASTRGRGPVRDPGAVARRFNAGFRDRHANMPRPAGTRGNLHPQTYRSSYGIAFLRKNARYSV